MDDFKIVLVFTNNKISFNNWVREYFSSFNAITNNDIMNCGNCVYTSEQGEKYKYICVDIHNPNIIRGFSDPEIMLLHGWDKTDKKKKILKLI